MSHKKPVAIDLFCGVGGMSLGFKQAGFRIAAAFDYEDRHISTYRSNFRRVAAFQADLRRKTGEELLRQAGLDSEDVDLVFGGPPCQGFSVGGKRRLDDERNSLVYDFAKLVRQIRPKYFVMENVQGILFGHTRSVLHSFCRRVRLAGYRVVEPIRVLDASQFGVPQRRRRTFVLGFRKDLMPPDYPIPAPIVDEAGRAYSPVVRDAISDLPDIDCIPSLFACDGYSGPLSAPSHYASLMRGEVREPSDNLPVRNRNGDSLTGCLRTHHTEDVVRRFASTRPGAAEPISRYIRLNMDDVAPTIRAGTGVDHGKHTSPRPIHPAHPRCITVREAARLHSYPDWYLFDPTRWHAFRQIGNSVPPRLARFVALAVLDALKADARRRKHEVHDG